MVAKKSLYEILGVEPDANDLDIGLAFQRRTFELQRIAGVDQNAIGMVQQAHEILADPKRRAAYDASLVTAKEKAAAADQAPDLVLEGGDEEAPKRKWLVPAIVGAVIAVVAGFLVTRGHAPEKAAPPPEAEAPKPAPPPPPPQPMKAEQILPNALRASGQLMSYNMAGTAVPLGIGFALEPGTIVTTCHGISAGSKLVFRQGAETLSADLTVIDELQDLCRFSVPGLAAKPLAVAPEDAKAGDRIYALGMNAKGEFALTDGTVKQLRTQDGVKVVEISIPVAASASGGPVLDTFGRVVGVATTPHRFGAGVNAAISSASIADMRSRSRAQ